MGMMMPRMAETYADNETNTDVIHQNHLHLEEIETLFNEVNALLRKNDGILDGETIRGEFDRLQRWMHCYHYNLVTDDVFAQESLVLASRLRERLKLRLEELQRLEGEGGLPANKGQALNNERLISAIRRIDDLMENIEWLLQRTETLRTGIFQENF